MTSTTLHIKDAGSPPKLPEPQAGRTQGRLDPTEVKKLLEDAPVNVTKPYKSPDLAIPKLPTTRLYTPEFARKPEFAA